MYACVCCTRQTVTISKSYLLPLIICMQYCIELSLISTFLTPIPILYVGSYPYITISDTSLCTRVCVIRAHTFTNRKFRMYSDSLSYLNCSICVRVCITINNALWHQIVDSFIRTLLIVDSS